DHETHLSTQPPDPQAPPRFPCPHGHQRWPRHSFAPPRAWPQAPLRLILPPGEGWSSLPAMQARKEKTDTLDRLKKRSDFLRVQKAGKKWVSKTVIVQTAPSETE